MGHDAPPDQPRSAVAIRGARPPANGEANCDPCEAPLYRTLVPNGSKKMSTSPKNV
jgi:hypothetical protein